MYNQNMSNKIISTNQLKNISFISKKNNKKIVLVHGVFDVVHVGHIHHFIEAKKHGELLVVSITGDKFVKKGFNKPYFDEEKRSLFLASLEVIDYVVINQNKSAYEIIKKLKPNIYCKGPDYKNKSGDIAGNLENEKKTVNKYGGKLLITKGERFSSTKILNNKFDDFNPGKTKINQLLLNDKEKFKIKDEFSKVLVKVKNEKILVIGEVILDEYRYSTPIGTPSKENILSVKYEGKKTFIGGTVPVVKTILELNKNITFVSLYKKKNIRNLIKKNLGKNVKCHLFYEKKFKEIYKTRFIDINNKQKFFEFYDFNNTEYENSYLFNYLNKNLHKFDKVIICDFGHGIFNNKITKLIQKKSKYLCANIQTNSGNRGFNLFTKYSNLDFLCIDEPEARLGLKERFLPIDQLIKSNSLKNYKNIIITRGIMGLIIKLDQSNNKILKFPALNTKVVDTLGAGDAVYSYCSSLIKNTSNHKLISIVGAIAGAIKTNILGHSSNIQLDEMKRSLDTILK